MTWIAGVDGCPTGWLCIARNVDTRTITAEVFPNARALLQATTSYAVLTIDVPIGLPDREPRECDLIARKLLGPGRASSVFPAPVRATLGAETWEEACQRSEVACGKSLSRQTFAILDRIQEVDEELCKDPGLQSKVREIHPEVCFYYWNGQAPMRASKKTIDGENERLLLIRTEFGSEFDAVRRKIHKRSASDDDVMDAFAALWTAQRIISGKAVTIPVDPPRDRCGLKMEMVA